MSKTNKPRRGRPQSSKKGQKPNKDKPFKGQSITPADEDRYEAGKDNDPSWYSVSNQMVKDTCNVSFNNPAGIPLALLPSGLNFTDVANKQAIPGIMRFDFVYGPGRSYDSNSALNLAARNIYAFVRHVNSGYSNYEAADLMMYLFGVGSLYVLYTELIRLYGFTLQYKQSNRYFNAAIIQAMGYDSADIEAHLPQLRFTINKFVRKLGTKPIPANLNIFHRLMYLTSQVFEDATVRKSQLYIFKPEGFYKYEELDEQSETGAYLHFMNRATLLQESGAGGAPTRLWTYDDVETVTSYLTNAILDSEDIGIISGDIIKAYGSNVHHLSEIDETFALKPFYSDEILDQIHNMTIVGAVEHMDITQTYNRNLGNIVLWEPLLSGYSDGSAGKDIIRRELYSGKQYLDLPYDEPSPIDVMVATRLMSIGGPSPCFMTELVTKGRMYNFVNGEVTVSNPFTSYYSYDDDDPISFAALSDMLCNISKFDKHPQIRFAVSNNHASEENPSFVMSNSLVDLYNYTSISENELQKMHETAVLSLWDVPESAFYTAK